MDLMKMIQGNPGVVLGFIPRSSRILAGSLFVGYAATWLLPLHWLVIVPVLLMPPHLYVWTLATAALVPVSAAQFAVSLPLLLALPAGLEPTWGLSGVWLALAIPYFVSVCVVIFLYAVLGLLVPALEPLWWPVGGPGALLMTLGLGVVAMVGGPRRPLPLVSTRSMPILGAYVPWTLLALELLLSVLRWSHGLTLTAVSFCVSFVYLRYFHAQRDGSRGERCTDFELAKFFPEVLHPTLSAATAPIAKIAASVGLIPAAALLPVTRRSAAGGPSGGVGASIPGMPTFVPGMSTADMMAAFAGSSPAAAAMMANAPAMNTHSAASSSSASAVASSSSSSAAAPTASSSSSSSATRQLSSTSMPSAGLSSSSHPTAIPGMDMSPQAMMAMAAAAGIKPPPGFEMPVDPDASRRRERGHAELEQRFSSN